MIAWQSSRSLALPNVHCCLQSKHLGVSRKSETSIMSLMCFEKGGVVLARFKERYQTEVVPALMERFSYNNVMQAPRFDKVVLNIGVGEAVEDPKTIEAATNDLEIISGQKPIITYAKKSVAAYKLREGMPIGCKVTLRGQRMYEFLDRLISITLPRIRDFRGLSEKSFDGRGNYSIGLREQLVFPEIEYDKIDKVRGLSVTIGTTAETDEEGYELLKLMGMPFRS